ncbi:hypothetical protein EMCRGX_G020265 [Ephydatia muelleri]
MERRCRANNLQPSINDTEQDHCEWIIPKEESSNFQYHSPAPLLDPTDLGTYLMSAVKPFYTAAGEENRLNSLLERYEEAPNLYTTN